MTFRSAALLCMAAFAACQEPAPPDPKRGNPSSSPDSTATTAEIRSSIVIGSAPRAEFSFRGLYAGMPRARLEATLLSPAASSDKSACRVSPKLPAELACSYDAMLGSDRARVQVSVVYGAPAANGIRTAREISVVRALPLDVDGVRVAAALADAFERETTVLDSRDATYGRHQAHIRMGTLRGPRTHFAEVTVITRSGREELTVRLGRGATGK